MELILRKDGFYLCGEKGENGGYQEEKIDKIGLIFLLSNWSSEFSIDGEVTFGELLSILKNGEPEVIHILSHLTNSNILPFIERDLNNFDKDIDGDISKLEVNMNVSIINNDIDIFYDCHGISMLNGAETEIYAIEFVPWGSLLSVPLYTNEKVSLTEYQERQSNGKGIEPDISSRELSFSRGKNGNLEISFGEYLKSLFTEVAFFGSPEERHRNSEELRASLNEIREIRESNG